VTAPLRRRKSDGRLAAVLERLQTKGVTDTLDDTIKDLLSLIERGLGDLSDRQLVSTAEVSDLLLDVRGLLVNLEGDRVPAGAPAE
jgi:hypothetical protein